MGKRTIHTVCAAKRTFWNDLRVANNLSMQEVASAIGVGMSTVGMWFSGAGIPRKESHLHAICDLFDVDYNVGYEEFVKANRTWDSERGHLRFDNVSDGETLVPLPTKSYKTKKETHKDAEVVATDLAVKLDPSSESEEARTTLIVFSDYLSKLYGKVDFRIFAKVCDAVLAGNNPAEYLYGAVDFDLFTELDSAWNLATSVLPSSSENLI